MHERRYSYPLVFAQPVGFRHGNCFYQPKRMIQGITMTRTKSTFLALVAILLSPMAANAVPITIDFDDLADNTVLTDQYAALGVTFSAFEDGAATDSVVGAFTNVSSPNVWSNCSPTICGDRADVLRIDFAFLVGSLMWYTDTAGSQQPIFNAYGQGGALLETVIATATNQGNFALTSFSSSGISYVELLQPSDFWGYLIDDLSFEATSVPEPGTLALLGIGLLGMGAARRRKKA